MGEYFKLTHRASYNFLFAGALLVLYELCGFLFIGKNGPANAVDVMFQMFLSQAPNGTLIVSMLLILATVIAVTADKKDEVPFDPFNFVMMLVESAIWAIVIFFNLGFVISQIPAEYLKILGGLATNASGGGGTSLLQNIGLSFGAGFYEELFFRLILVFGLNWTFRLAGQNPEMIINRLAIIFITAAVFSLAHFKFIVGSMGDDWNVYLFLFRFVFGVLMSLLLMFRGFGIAAWSHALYDVLVYTLRAF